MFVNNVHKIRQPLLVLMEILLSVVLSLTGLQFSRKLVIKFMW